jgi:dolichyl-phosphate beta-glucosyltransferase
VNASASIVVPCFNEEGRWNADYWRSMLALESVRWVFVDDGSRDGTRGFIDDLVETSSGIARAVHLDRNRGKAEAVRAGMLAALDDGGRSVGFMDADGAFAVGDVERFVALMSEKRADDVDSLWSSRVALAGRDIHRSDSRHYLGRLVATVLTLGEEYLPYDTQSGFKLYVADDRLRGCLDEPFSTRWMFDLELYYRWRRLQGSPMRVWEEPLQSWRDVAGSKVTGRESIRAIREIAAVKRLQRSSR